MACQQGHKPLCRSMACQQGYKSLCCNMACQQGHKPLCRSMACQHGHRLLCRSMAWWTLADTNMHIEVTSCHRQYSVNVDEGSKLMLNTPHTHTQNNANMQPQGAQTNKACAMPALFIYKNMTILQHTIFIKIRCYNHWQEYVLHSMSFHKTVKASRRHYDSVWVWLLWLTLHHLGSIIKCLLNTGVYTHTFGTKAFWLTSTWKFNMSHVDLISRCVESLTRHGLHLDYTPHINYTDSLCHMLPR